VGQNLPSVSHILPNAIIESLGHGITLWEMIKRSYLVIYSLITLIRYLNLSIFGQLYFLDFFNASV
jgi:hypothetical protein